MFGVGIQVRSLVHRVFNKISVRNYAFRFKKTSEDDTPLTAAQPKLRKRVKYRKPDWVTKKTLWVYGFPRMCTDMEISQLFSTAGPVIDFRRFPYAPFCWVTFEHLRHADRARRELHGYRWTGWWGTNRMIVYEGRREGEKRRPIPECISNE